jgi:RHS repeat-associated protein
VAPITELWVYGYDVLYRLVNAASFDPLTDQLTGDGKYTYAYDANGNLSAKTEKSGGKVVKYSYDVYNRLSAVEMFASATASAPYSRIGYAYDWAGRLMERDACGTRAAAPQLLSGDCSGAGESMATVRYAYEGVNLVAEFDARGNVLASYYHLPGSVDHPQLMKRGDQVFYYHYDELGSVTQITNAAGQIVKEYKYDSFGRIVLETGDLENPFTYTGRFWDAGAGLYHYRARAYDPESGRFLQQDPIFSVNPYPYAGGNPANFVDPFGLSAAPEKIPVGKGPCNGIDCTRTRWWGNGYGYCEMVACDKCGVLCNSCWRKKCSTIYGPDHSRVYYAEVEGWSAGCRECWYGATPIACSLACKDDNDPDCFSKCMRGGNDSGGPGGRGFNPTPGSKTGKPGVRGGQGIRSGNGSDGVGGGGNTPQCGDPVWGKDLNFYDFFNQVRDKGHAEFRHDSDMRHCTASCYLSASRGDDITRIMGVGNEVEGFIIYDFIDSIIHPQNGIERWVTQTRGRAADTRDILMNEIGIKGSQNSKSWKECIVYCQSAPRPNVNPVSMPFMWLK